MYLRSIATAVVLCFLGVRPSVAASIAVHDFPEGCGIAIRGTIVSTDPANFEQILVQRPDCSAVAFDSEYGQEASAIVIGRMIRARRMLTSVFDGGTCAGPCVFAFMGGTARVVEPKARVGLRMPSFVHNERIIRQTRSLIQRFGPNSAEAVVVNAEKSAFEIVGALGHYVMSMGVSPDILTMLSETSHNTTRWLSPEQITGLNLSVKP